MANKLLVLTFQHKGSVTVEAQPELVDAVPLATMKCAACLLRIRWFTAPPGSPVLINSIDDSSRSCYAATLLAYCNRGAHLSTQLEISFVYSKSICPLCIVASNGHLH